MDLYRRVNRRFGLVVAAVLLLPALTSCASGSFRLGQRDPAPKGVDVEVLRDLVCHGDIARATELVALRGGSVADQIEAVERARKDVAGREGCCPTPKCSMPATPAGGGH